MKKIVELLIKNPDFESDELGVDVVSLVETPAIGYTWQMFAEQEFVEPTAGESEDQFIGRCMSALEGEFPDKDQRLAVCYSSWEGFDVDAGNLSPYKDQDDEKLIVKVQNAIYTAAETLGEEHDPESTTYLTIHSFADGATVAGIADAVKALDILKGRADSTEELQTVYKYEGPISGNSRKFCRAMVRLSQTKFWTRQDINRMTAAGVNSDFNSPIRGGNYDIFRYAGGARCRHRWVEYKMFKNTEGRTLLINVGDASTAPANTANAGFVNNEQRKKADQWYAINKNRFAKQHEFAIDSEDERIVVAPCMVPNNLIRRVDEKGMEYYVYFSKETVKDISEKYFAKNHTNNTDINHDGAVTKSNTVLESWIVDDPNVDKSKLYGFDVPAGTWMMSMRINDETTWSKIKNGELKGYSVAGNFLELAK